MALAAGHVLRETYGIGVPPSLRRVHYLLVSDAEAQALGYRNTEQAYKRLSAVLADARRAGSFPDLADNNRSIEVPYDYASTAEALRDLSSYFRLSRRAHSSRRVLIGVEKAGLVPLIQSRFGWLEVTALRGYSSHTHLRKLDRFDVILYVGDFDPTGLDIERDLSSKVPGAVVRVALTREQVDEHSLVEQPAKDSDSRKASMVREFGAASQVEVDALAPAILLDELGVQVSEATGLQLDAGGQPIIPGLAEEEAAARARLLELAEEYR